MTDKQIIFHLGIPGLCGDATWCSLAELAMDKIQRNCLACLGPRNQHTLESFLRGWKGEFRSAKVIPIVTSRVPEIELRQIISESGISSPIYIAQAEIRGIEDLYFDFGRAEGTGA